MKMRIITCYLLLFLSCLSSNAWANPVPMIGAIGASIMMVISLLMIGISLIGGAYIVIGKGKRAFGVGFELILVLMLLPFAAFNFWIALIGFVFFLVFAFVRGMEMIVWGVKAKFSPDNERFDSVDPWRLIFGGAILILMMIVPFFR